MTTRELMLETVKSIFHPGPLMPQEWSISIPPDFSPIIEVSSLV